MMRRLGSGRRSSNPRSLKPLNDPRRDMKIGWMAARQSLSHQAKAMPLGLDPKVGIAAPTHQLRAIRRRNPFQLMICALGLFWGCSQSNMMFMVVMMFAVNALSLLHFALIPASSISCKKPD